jgi:hypothetical protein
VHRELRSRDHKTSRFRLAVRAGAAKQHVRTEAPTAAADRARRALQMDARVTQRTTDSAVAAFAGRVHALRGKAMVSGAAARLLNRRRVLGATPTRFGMLLRRLPAGTVAAAAAVGRAARRGVPVEVLDGRVRTGADQRGRYGGAAMAGGMVQRRAPAGNSSTVVGTGPPRPRPGRADRPKAYLSYLSWMFSDAPALMSARTDRRSAAKWSAVHPHLCRQGRGGFG